MTAEPEALGGDADGVSVAIDGSVLRIRIERPERKGALDVAAVHRIIAALEASATHDSLRVVSIASEGDDFCTGADLVSANEQPGGPAAQKPRTGSLQRRLAVQAHRLIAVMLEVQLPIVCAVRGWAAGLGCQVALASDFCVADAEARFAAPFLRRGFTADSGSTWLLPRLVGLARARQILMLGRTVSGGEAEQWGMIHKAVAEPDLDATAEALVTELAAGPTVALGLTKRCLNAGSDRGIVEAMEAEAMALELSSRSADFREGMAAFAERRDPEFRGR